MDLDTLKSNYKNADNETIKSMGNLGKMRHPSNHPVLKKIRLQLIIESLLWAFILIVFYDFFDGHLRSFFWNVLLAISIILLLTHNFLGYLLVQKPINDDNIKSSLKGYLVKIKKYSIVSIVSRVLTVVIFMLYLTSNSNWDVDKLWTFIGFFILLILTQIFLLGKIWHKRIKIIKDQIENMK